MRIVLSLVLLTGLVSVGHGVPENPKPAKPAVPVLTAGAVFRSALEQVTSASPKLRYNIATPITSLEAGLRHLKKTSDKPILAMAERGGWFFYATSVMRDGETGAPVSMISGYAIKRDGRRVVGWGVW